MDNLSQKLLNKFFNIDGFIAGLESGYNKSIDGGLDSHSHTRKNKLLKASKAVTWGVL